jgi:7-cyano-7-deazaguanine reductase
LGKRRWSKKSKLLFIKNTCPGHIHILKTRELTFEGFPGQPDYAEIQIEVHPKERAVELKSVKEYLKQFRNKHISYERILNCLLEDFWKIYKPRYLKVTIETNARGGISSILTVDRGKKKPAVEV